MTFQVYTLYQGVGSYHGNMVGIFEQETFLKLDLPKQCISEFKNLMKASFKKSSICVNYPVSFA